MDAREKLQGMAAQVAAECGYELVEIDQFRAGRRSVVRIYLHKEGGVLVSDCAEFSHRLSALLDLEDPFTDPYILEVSSPGLDRPLKTKRDFERNLGRNVKIQLGQGKPIRGVVQSPLDTEVVLDTKAGEVRVPYAGILSAKVDLQL